MSGAVDERAKRPRPSRPLGSRRRWVSVFLALMVAVAAAFGGGLYWNWNHDARDLYEYVGGITFTTHEPASDAVYVNAAIAPSSHGAAIAAVKVERVVPHITTNTANARVQEILTCKITPQSLMPTVDRDTSNCLSLGRFVPGSLALGNPGIQIIYKLSVAQAGTVRIEGSDIAYSDANQSGHQRVGIGVVIRFIRPARSR